MFCSHHSRSGWSHYGSRGGGGDCGGCGGGGGGCQPMDFHAKDSNNVFQGKQKKSIDSHFIPRVICTNVLTMLNPLLSSERVERINLLRGKIEWERVGVVRYFH